MRATMYGCEIVWPAPIGSAASSYARRRERGGHEQLARDPRHRVEHALVVDPARRAAAARPCAAAPSRAQAACARARTYGGGSTPKCASTAGTTSVIRSGAASIPIVSSGTIESPAVSEPWLPPPA